MPQIIPIDMKDFLCLCGDIHHWVRGELAYQCDQCGRTYLKRKELDFAFSSGHIRYEVDGDQVIKVEDYEI